MPQVIFQHILPSSLRPEKLTAAARSQLSCIWVFNTVIHPPGMLPFSQRFHVQIHHGICMSFMYPVCAPCLLWSPPTLYFSVSICYSQAGVADLGVQGLDLFCTIKPLRAGYVPVCVRVRLAYSGCSMCVCWIHVEWMPLRHYTILKNACNTLKNYLHIYEMLWLSCCFVNHY